jgi:hypothetical protein
MRPSETGDFSRNRARTPRLRGQTMLVVLRIAAVRSDIGVFLNDPGPRLAGSIEKDAFTSLLCPSGALPNLGSRHVRVRHRPWGQERGPRYRVHRPRRGMRFWITGSLSAHSSRKRQILPYDRRSGQCRDLRHVVSGRDFDNIHSGEANPRQPPQDRLHLP